MIGFTAWGMAAAAAAVLGVALAETPQGPEDIVLQPGLSDEAAQALQDQDRAQLQRFLDGATTVAIGKVIASRPDALSPQAQIVSLLIEERLRGDAGADTAGILEIAVPLVRGRSGQGEAPVIEGYRLLVMLDRRGALVEDAALYLVQADHLWRNRSDAVFLRPGADREWTEEIDPLQDYVVLPLADVRALVLTTPPAKDAPRERWWRRSRGGGA